MPKTDVTQQVVPATISEAYQPKAMSEQAVDAYLSRLSQTNGEGLTGLEAVAEAKLREIGARMAMNVQQFQNVETNIAHLQNQKEKLQGESKMLGGQMDAYVNLLVMAEDERRVKAQETEATQEAIDGDQLPKDFKKEN